MIKEFINRYRLSEGFTNIANEYYIPLAEEIAMHHYGARKTYFVGINGSQGSGKSTLSEFIKDYLIETHALKVVVMSLDDFYLSRVERDKLAVEISPLFRTRGVPGTHNMSMAKSVIDSLKSGENTTIPRFNKAIDNPHPEALWSKVMTTVDVVIFEGWCWGVTAQEPKKLDMPVNQMEDTHDKDAKWRTYANQQLSLNYQPLYAQMDLWIMLKSPSFKAVFKWRLEQEKKLILATDSEENNGLMSEQQIYDFIQFYQRLTEHGLNTLPDSCDHVFKLNSERKIMQHVTKEFHA
jgi:D-glycerate 3-kinase